MRETLRLIAKLSLNSVRHQLDPDSTLPDEESQMPLDGDSLMERIMSGEDEEPPEPGLDPDTELPEILEDSAIDPEEEVLLGADGETPSMEVQMSASPCEARMTIDLPTNVAPDFLGKAEILLTSLGAVTKAALAGLVHQ